MAAREYPAHAHLRCAQPGGSSRTLVQCKGPPARRAWSVWPAQKGVKSWRWLKNHRLHAHTGTTSSSRGCADRECERPYRAASRNAEDRPRLRRTQHTPLYQCSCNTRPFACKDFVINYTIHLTIMRNTNGENTDIRCYIAGLASTNFLKLQESNFLLYATRFSIMRSLVKRLGMGLPKRQERKDDDVRRGASGMMERRGSS
jgi:hypothetical protein